MSLIIESGKLIPWEETMALVSGGQSSGGGSEGCSLQDATVPSVLTTWLMFSTSLATKGELLSSS